VTGSYPQFMQTSDGRAILGRQPTLTDMLSSVNQGAPSSVGGFGGAPKGLGSPGGAGGGTVGPMGATSGPIFGRGDLALGGGTRGLSLLPGTGQASNPVPGQGVPTGASNLGALLHQLIGTGAGGGGTGGAGGGAPGGIGAGESAQAQGDRFAQANAAVQPSVRNALQMAGLVMSPMTAPQQLLGDYLGSMMGFGSGFNVPGPRLTPQQLQQVSAAYQQYGPAYAQRMLAAMRQAALGGAIRGGGPVVGPGATPMGGFGTIATPQGPMLSANFTSPGFGLTPATWGGMVPGGGGGGGGGYGGGPPDTGGGLGGGPGNMGGGENRSM